MAQSLRTVEFNEGEPLDPNKLNDLKFNIIVAYEAALKNTSDTGEVTRFDSGFVNIKVVKGIGLSDEVSLGTFTNAFIIPSIGGTLNPGAQATLSIVNPDKIPQIRVSISPAVSRTLRVNYLLVSKEKTE